MTSRCELIQAMRKNCDFIDGRVRCLGKTTKRTRCSRLVTVEVCVVDAPCPGHFCYDHKIQGEEKAGGLAAEPLRVRCCATTKKGKQCAVTVEVIPPLDENSKHFCHNHILCVLVNSPAPDAMQVTCEPTKDESKMVELFESFSLIVNRLDKIENQIKENMGSCTSSCIESSGVRAKAEPLDVETDTDTSMSEDESTATERRAKSGSSESQVRSKSTVRPTSPSVKRKKERVNSSVPRGRTTDRYAPSPMGSSSLDTVSRASTAIKEGKARF